MHCGVVSGCLRVRGVGVGQAWRKFGDTASRFPSELGVHGTMRLPNRKEELAHEDCSAPFERLVLIVGQIQLEAAAAFDPGPLFLFDGLVVQVVRL